MSNMSEITHDLLFFIFMLVLIVFLIGGYIGILGSLIGRVRMIVQQLINVLYVWLFLAL